MKKLISLILATLTALTLTVSATACTPKDDATIEVGILQVATHSALDSAREGFKEVVDALNANDGILAAKYCIHQERILIDNTEDKRTLKNS